jgi:DNA-binding NtrC family response regulator
MAYPLLVIEADSTPADTCVERMLCADVGLQCRRLSWEALARGEGKAERRGGVLAVAVPFTAEVAAVFEGWRSVPIGGPTLAVLPNDAGESVVRLAANAADDFMLAPVRELELRERVKRLFGPAKSEVDAVRERLLEELGMAQLIGRDPVFLRAVEQIPKFARSGMPVLITGETGTGKELCARALHHLGPRRTYPFIAVDCGAIPDHLFENELFGHTRGAYTDAHRDQRGLVAMAEGGTLFLDEIDALSLQAQGKLLRLLQEHSYRPLGAERFEEARVNIVAATNRDLDACVVAKTFRSDLYFRLNVLRLDLPPLRRRVTDIELLAGHFLAEARVDGEIRPQTISAAALRALASHHWLGNVRELCNVVRRAAVACDGPRILPCHLAIPGLVAVETETADFRPARAAAVAAFERRYVEEMLRKHGGNVTHAAREARKDRRVFGRLMKKYGIGGGPFR